MPRCSSAWCSSICRQQTFSWSAEITQRHAMPKRPPRPVQRESRYHAGLYGLFSTMREEMRQRPATWRAVVICAATTVAAAGCTSGAQPRAATAVSGAAAAPETEPTLRIIEANGIKMRIAEMGKGPLVLFLHGFPESWYSWRHQLPALAKAGYHAAAIDVRGYGRSSAPAAIDAYRMIRLVA